MSTRYSWVSTRDLPILQVLRYAQKLKTTDKNIIIGENNLFLKFQIIQIKIKDGYLDHIVKSE